MVAATLAVATGCEPDELLIDDTVFTLINDTT